MKILIRFQARRTLLAKKGLARLKSSMQRQAVTRQKKLLEKHTKETAASEVAYCPFVIIPLHNLMGEDWDDNTRSWEHAKTHLQNRQEAAVRRERAMGYAFNHQQTWRKPASSSTNTMFLDPNNPYWGWSWLERWIAAKTSETASANPEKELNNGLKSSKDAAFGSRSTTKSTVLKQLQYPGKTSGQKHAHVAAPLPASTINPSKTVSPKSVINRKLKPPTPKASTKAVSSRSSTRGSPCILFGDVFLCG